MQFNIFCLFVEKAGDLHADLIRQHLVVLICFFLLSINNFVTTHNFKNIYIYFYEYNIFILFYLQL